MSPLLEQISANAYHRRQLKRNQVEELLALADYLPAKDKILIEHILGNGIPVARIAKLYQRPPRQLQRRAAIIIKRLSSKMFKFVALHMNTLPEQTRPIARYVILHGLSLREAARASGTSLHHVRTHMNTVQATARLLT